MTVVVKVAKVGLARMPDGSALFGHQAQGDFLDAREVGKQRMTLADHLRAGTDPVTLGYFTARGATGSRVGFWQPVGDPETGEVLVGVFTLTPDAQAYRHVDVIRRAFAEAGLELRDQYVRPADQD